MTITEFLLARIAEDREAAAQADWAMQKQWFTPDEDSATDAHVARFSPARVLAECEAKRRIVTLHDNPCPDCLAARRCIPHESSAGGSGVVRYRDPIDALTLHSLALPYADHPDYDEAWNV